MNRNNYLQKKEIAFLGKNFASQLTECIGLKGFPISDDRLYPREKFLIKRMKHFINSKTKILEIGGGNFKTIKVLLDPDTYNFFYVGSDVSFNALKIGQKNIKTGEFIQCDVESLPFLPESFDIVFSFGVLHHTPSLEENVPNLFKILKNNGLLVLHEPVFSNDRHKPQSLEFIKRCILGNVEIAPMQSKLKESKLFHYLQKQAEIILIKKEYSPIRLILVKIFRSLIPKSLSLLKFILLLDDLAIQLSKLLDIALLKYAGIR